MEENDTMNANLPTKSDFFFFFFYFLSVFVNHMRYITPNFTLQYVIFYMQCQAKWTYVILQAGKRLYSWEELIKCDLIYQFSQRSHEHQKKTSWLIYFIHFIHSSQTASHTFLLLLKSAGKKTKPPLHGISLLIILKFKTTPVLKSVAVWYSQNIGTIQLFRSIE